MIRHEPALRETMATNLAGHPVRTVNIDHRKRAAVAIVVVDSGPDATADAGFAPPWVDMTGVPGDIDGFDGRIESVAGGAAFLLCRRPERMNRHAGQWALPGGRLDDGETPEQAALRELHEELGMLVAPDAVLGRLDDYPTRSGFVITPIVVWGGANVELVPDPTEVAHVLQIGLHELCRGDSPRYVSIPESDRPVVQLPIGRDLIHAPTGAVLLQFRWVAIEGQLGARVDELEQPVFAWR
jgi:8-oxo-dGTP pyrophosphatase MutT (NUDIX family)